MVLNITHKYLCICKKQAARKSVNNHTVNLVDVCALPDIAEMTVSRLHTEKAGGRLCASDYHLGKRQNDSYQNSVYRTQNKYSEKSTNKYEKFCPADLPQSLCQMKLRGTHER